MNGADERLILRWLAGELGEPEVRALRQRLLEDPILVRRYRELEGLWNGELSEWAAREIEISRRLDLRAALAATARGRGPFLPVPRMLGALGAAAVLAGGIALGALVGGSLSPGSGFESGELELRPALAEAYAEGLAAQDFGGSAAEDRR